MHAFASSIGVVLAGKVQFKDPSKGDCGKERGRGRRNFRGRGGRNKRSDLQCKRCGNTGHTSDHCWASWDSIKDSITRRKMIIKIKMLVNLLILFIVLLHIGILELMK